MALSIFDISVSPYQRTLSSLSVCLDRGLAHFTKQGINPEDVKFIRLTSNMKPFDFQVQAAVHHCLGGVKALKEQTFGPVEVQDLTYAGLQQFVGDAVAALDAIVPGDVNESAEQVVTFRHGDLALPFTAENFVLAFSLPNLYFHTTTAYDILRMKGVRLGKVDFLGTLPTH